MCTGQRRREGWRAGQRGRELTHECGHPSNGKKVIILQERESVNSSVNKHPVALTSSEVSLNNL